MFKLKTLAAATLAAALAAPAFATIVALPTTVGQSGYGQWMQFNVNDLDSRSLGVEWIDNANSLSPDFGNPLSFTFTIAAGSQGPTGVDHGRAHDHCHRGR